MNEENSILQELSSMGSPLAGLPRTMPYSVPEGYFADFPGSLSVTVATLNEPEIVPDWGKTMPYSVPKGYFEDLTHSLVTVATYEPSESAKTTPFAAPAGYFEDLPSQMLKAAKASDPKGKTVPLNNHNVFRSVQWAAAAIFVIFMGIGSYITFFSTPQANPEIMLASVAKTDIHDYLQRIYRIDVDQVTGNNEINNLQLDNKEIIEYLNETGWDVVE